MHRALYVIALSFQQWKMPFFGFMSVFMLIYQDPRHDLLTYDQKLVRNSPVGRVIAPLRKLHNDEKNG